MENAIEIVHVTKKFKETVAVNGVTVSLERGKFARHHRAEWVRQDGALSMHLRSVPGDGGGDYRSGPENGGWETRA